MGAGCLKLTTSGLEGNTGAGAACSGEMLPRAGGGATTMLRSTKEDWSGLLSEKPSLGKAGSTRAVVMATVIKAAARRRFIQDAMSVAERCIQAQCHSKRKSKT